MQKRNVPSLPPNEVKKKKKRRRRRRTEMSCTYSVLPHL